MTSTGRAAAAGARIGIDVGGTFTDLVASVPDRGLVVHHKEPSTPADPSLAVADGLAALLARAELRPEEVTGLVHGTTIGLNAVIQRRGARIALVVTEGYRDILEIGRSRMPSSFDLYAGKEEPLVPRNLIVEIAARLGPRGEPVAEPDAAELDRVAARLRATGADAAAVVILHGYTDPAFEEGVAAGLRERLPSLPVTASATVWPEVREYERALVACMNAYIQPLMRDYFARLEGRVRGLGVSAPIFISASNGGSMSLRSAAERPVETVLSGPAAGVAAAARLGAGAIVTFDMGGTSSDIAVSVDGSPELATHTTVGGLPLIVPVVAVHAIGAGGGSVIRVDGQGVLKVGPGSAGADPGPAAYGRGGDRPTVTDCYLATGLIDPRTFLGGRMPLDAGASLKALSGLAPHLASGGERGEPAGGDVAGPDGPGGEVAAYRVAASALRVATAGMATELQKIMAQRGLDPRRFALVPFGGAGPTHAALLAEEVGIGHIVVPPTAATFCALGAAGADLRRDFARSLRRPLDAASATRLAGVLAELSARAQEWLAEQNGEARLRGRLSFAADMRYSGQAYELRVDLDPERLDAEAVSEAFHAEHERLYGFRDQSATIELGTARLGVVGPVAGLPPAAVPPGTGAPHPTARRRVLLAGAWHDAHVHARESLGVGDAFDGPAIVEQDDTTVVVPPGWSADVDEAGNLHLRRTDGAHHPRRKA
ncbi:hydantoinase/oxoprolinase family protein [Nonomuraea jabiensis]|uniref:N-methylhydantoinase A n=1 Tax=Nonomuraea jabiensis TaxID=882448 RepID=A0A7W9LG16_9ACTN|nr:hydantoinase/oxoprolinase family protein [Nonomuraea jabiensis]MBB5782471.1 N-methylhydantoinase A [Nonomuraea jabiensis]